MIKRMKIMVFFHSGIICLQSLWLEIRFTTIQHHCRSCEITTFHSVMCRCVMVNLLAAFILQYSTFTEQKIVLGICFFSQFWISIYIHLQDLYTWVDCASLTITTNTKLRKKCVSKWRQSRGKQRPKFSHLPHYIYKNKHRQKWRIFSQ